MFETLENLKKFVGIELPNEKKELRALKKEIRKDKKSFLDEFRAIRKQVKEITKNKKEVVPQVVAIQRRINELTKRQPKVKEVVQEQPQEVLSTNEPTENVW